MGVASVANLTKFMKFQWNPVLLFRVLWSLHLVRHFNALIPERFLIPDLMGVMHLTWLFEIVVLKQLLRIPRDFFIVVFGQI